MNILLWPNKTQNAGSQEGNTASKEADKETSMQLVKYRAFQERVSAVHQIGLCCEVEYVVIKNNNKESF